MRVCHTCAPDQRGTRRPPAVQRKASHEAHGTLVRGASNLQTRGNGPVRIAMMQRMQQTQGNRAVQRFIQRQAAPGAQTDQTLPNLKSPRFQAVADFEDVLAGKKLLRSGNCNGPITQAVQEALGATGHDPGPLDGLWGGKTSKAVTDFQRAEGISADAVIGPQTMARLDAADAPAGGDAGNVFRTVVGTKGDSGQGDALEIQLARLLGVPVAAITRARPQAEGLQPFDQFVDTIAGSSGDTGETSLFAARPEAPESEGDTGGGASNITPGDLQTTINTLNYFKSYMQMFVGPGKQIPLDQAEVDKTNTRLDALIFFYNSQLNASNNNTGNQVNPKTQAIISIGISQIGAVESRKSAGKDTSDEKQRELRVGGERLTEYFTKAYGGSGPGKFHTDETKYLPEPNKPDTLQDWCGIFHLWVYKSAGLSVGDWKMGSSIGAVDNMRGLVPFTVPKANEKKLVKGQPRPGDMATIAAKEHQYMIVEIKPGGSLVTMEANTDGSGGAQGGQITMHDGKRRLTDTQNYSRPVDLDA